MSRNPSAISNSNGMGMGMGMGMMGMHPFATGMTGFPYSPMMGGYGGAGMMGPFSFIYSLNYFIASFSQIVNMLGANSFMVVELFHTIKNVLKDVEMNIRRSAFRKWIQRKSKKSAVFRYLFVLSSMFITSQLIRIARYLLEQKLGLSPSSSKSIAAIASGMSDNSKIKTTSNSIADST